MRLKPLVTLVILLLAPIFAKADSLAGQTITSTYYYPNVGTVYASSVITVVPGGIVDFASFADVTFSANSILITPVRNADLNNVPFDGFAFTDPDFVFSSVTLDASSTYAGFTASRITVSGDEILVNVEDLPGLAGQTILLDVQGNSTGVPEPSSLILLGAALAGLVGLKKAIG